MSAESDPVQAGEQSRLERRYQRLLAAYPAGHRRAHGQEMLGVLMTGAHAGQRRPGLAESADLIWGAVRIRLWPGQASGADPGWREAQRERRPPSRLTGAPAPRLSG